ncbi:MAG TPA: hypothetical protein PL034_01815 [Candidatus Paceibacterota bacterium]|nr:hypothetical protein [Candidatus Paceibacterota bacterium]
MTSVEVTEVVFQGFLIGAPIAGLAIAGIFIFLWLTTKNEILKGILRTLLLIEPLIIIYPGVSIDPFYTNIMILYGTMVFIFVFMSIWDVIQNVAKVIRGRYR